MWFREMHRMKIAIGSDHAGFIYKERIRDFLEKCGHSVTDFGTHSEDLVDYPLFIRPVAEAVARAQFERGVVLGGSGNGEAIVANRIKTIRCTLCWNIESARLARQHNDANVLSLGQRLIAEADLMPIVTTWLTTEFRGRRMGAGPEHLLRAGLPDRLAGAGHEVHVRVLEAPADSWQAEIRTAFDLARGVAEAVRQARGIGAFPLVLSGNCGPAALGCVAGLGPSTSILWFDTHGDFNTPETTP